MWPTKELFKKLTSEGIETSLSSLKQWALEKKLQRQKIVSNNLGQASYLWRDEAENQKDFFS